MSGLAVTLRSVSLGLLGAVLIAAVTPFNNFVANNTFLVGNLMPAAAIGLLLTGVLLLNGPLYRFRPRWALSRGEFTLAFSMWLVACAIPSAGLMRYLPAQLIAPFYFAEHELAYRDTIARSLPADWVFPQFDVEDPAARGRDPLVRYFVGSNPDASGLAAVPWKRWIRPAVAWGVLIVLLYGAIISLSTILHHQWARNERLSFPLAEVYSSLLESPQQGRSLPPLFSSKVFWAIAGCALALHLSNGLAVYQPKWPAIPLGYNFWSLFSEEPFTHLTFGAKSNKIMLTVIGVCYFIPTKVAGSLLAFFLAYNISNMVLGPVGAIPTLGAQRDQTLGAVVLIAATIVYTGRHHWLAVLRAMLGQKCSEDSSENLPQGAAGWILAACIAGIVTWLWLAGSGPINALLIILALLTLFIVTARIVAETGLIYVQIHTAMYRPWIPAADFGLTTNPQGYHLLGKVYSIWGHDLRENTMVYTQSALATADRSEPMPGRRWGLPACMLLALVVAFFVGGAATLVSQYNYQITTDRTQQSPVNAYGLLTAPRENVFDVTRAFMAPEGTGFRELHSRSAHFGFGAAVTGLITVGHLRWPGFPVHPIGSVMAYSYALQNTWFSIFIGWLAKAAIVRYTGPGGYRAARPVFLGLIFGETAAILAWIVINLLLAAAGIEYQQINILI